MANLSIGYDDNIGLDVIEFSQLQFVENLAGHDGAGFGAYLNHSASFQAINIPVAVPFKNLAVLVSATSFGTSTSKSIAQTYQIGLYSLNLSTLTLVNSASATFSKANTGTVTSWVSFVTSAASTIPPGTWYLAFWVSSGGGTSALSFWGQQSSINPGNAIPGGIIQATMTQSTAAIPTSIATSKLGETGQNALRQPYIIITT